MRPARHHLPLAFAALAATLGALAACADERRPITGLEGPDAPRAAPSASVTPAAPAFTAREALAGAVDDALERVLASLEPGPELTALRLALAELGRALDAPAAAPRDVPGAATRAERLLDVLERRHAGEPGALAELSAVRLVLDRAVALAP
jgi:hypothetical protein